MKAVRLGRPNQGEQSGTVCGRDSRRGRKIQIESIGRRNAADGSAGEAGAGGDALYAFAHRCLRSHCVDSRLRRAVRRIVKCRAAANVGDRRPDGARRDAGSIFKLVVRHGLRLSMIGVAAGMIAALGLTRAMTSMLVGVKATDPLTFAGMAALFLIIAAVASGLPARRAAGLDPTIALREE